MFRKSFSGINLIKVRHYGIRQFFLFTEKVEQILIHLNEAYASVSCSHCQIGVTSNNELNLAED